MNQPYLQRPIPNPSTLISSVSILIQVTTMSTLNYCNSSKLVCLPFSFSQPTQPILYASVKYPLWHATVSIKASLLSAYLTSNLSLFPKTSPPSPHTIPTQTLSFSLTAHLSVLNIWLIPTEDTRPSGLEHAASDHGMVGLLDISLNVTFSARHFLPTQFRGHPHH